MRKETTYLISSLFSLLGQESFCLRLHDGLVELFNTKECLSNFLAAVCSLYASVEDSVRAFVLVPQRIDDGPTRAMSELV